MLFGADFDNDFIIHLAVESFDILDRESACGIIDCCRSQCLIIGV